MQDFEKLGQFYLGKEIDQATGERTEDLLMYDSRDLCTHAVVVGMTGSGKTGLCLDLLEEAAIDRIPAIVIDPKGDIANLMLTFPNLTPEEFRPWIDEKRRFTGRVCHDGGRQMEGRFSQLGPDARTNSNASRHGRDADLHSRQQHRPASNDP